MLVDERHPKIRLALVILSEAYDRGVLRIELHRRECSFAIAYVFGESIEERDVIPNRHWHGLIAAFHILAYETAFRYATMTDEFVTKSDEIFNRIEIGRDFPNIENSTLRDLQNRLKGPFIAEFSFNDARVRIEFQKCEFTKNIEDWIAPGAIVITNNVEYEKAESEIRDLQERLQRLKESNPIGSKGFTKAGIRKMIARLHEELALYEGSEEARESKGP